MGIAEVRNETQRDVSIYSSIYMPILTARLSTLNKEFEFQDI